MQTVYLDTFVFGGCYDREFKKSSNLLLGEFKKGIRKMMVSDLVMGELKTARPEIRLKPFTVPSLFFIKTQNSSKALIFAERYITGGALTNRSRADAIHIANATLQGADIVASWNFKHMVNTETAKLFNKINKEEGYRYIDILTPTEILNPSL